MTSTYISHADIAAAQAAGDSAFDAATPGAKYSAYRRAFDAEMASRLGTQGYTIGERVTRLTGLVANGENEDVAAWLADIED